MHIKLIPLSETAFFGLSEFLNCDITVFSWLYPSHLTWRGCFYSLPNETYVYSYSTAIKGLIHIPLNKFHRSFCTLITSYVKCKVTCKQAG